MSQVIFGSLLNENVAKNKPYRLPSSLESNCEKQLHEFVDKTHYFRSPPIKPQKLSQMPNFPFTELNSLNSNFTLKNNLSEPDSGYCESGDSEKEEHISSHRETLLEIDNHHLTEQNRMLTKELIGCKSNVESYKKVICKKETQLENFALEQKNLQNRIRELEDMVEWFHSHAPHSLWNSCPYSPANVTSSMSSLGSEDNSSDKPSKQSTVSNFSKNEPIKHDSYRFMRNLFKFNQTKTKTRTKDNEEWINCDELIEESIVIESFEPNKSTRSSSFEFPRLKTTKKDSRTIFSSLRLNKHTTTPSFDETSLSSKGDENKKHFTSDNFCSRTELRNRITSRPIPSDALSPQTTSPTLNCSDSLEEEEDLILDVDAELAALSPLDFESVPDLRDNVFSEHESTITSDKMHSICETIEFNSLGSESLSSKEISSNNSIKSEIEIETTSITNSISCNGNHKEQSPESQLSISHEKSIDVVSINSPLSPSQTKVVDPNNSYYDSYRSSTSSLVDFEKLAQRPDRPLPLTPISPYFSLKLVASQKIKNGLSLFRIKKAFPARRRSSRRRPLSGTSIRSLNAHNKAHTSLEKQ